MTIQLPVLLWTVICFVLLMLILSRLLFRPLLDFMDKREEKIRSAALKLEEIEAARQEAEEKLARFREEEAARTESLAKEAIAEAERDAAAILASAAEEQRKALEACRASMEAEGKEVAKAAEAGADKVARAYLSALLDSCPAGKNG